MPYIPSKKCQTRYLPWNFSFILSYLLNWIFVHFSEFHHEFKFQILSLILQLMKCYQSKSCIYIQYVSFSMCWSWLVRFVFLWWFHGECQRTHILTVIHYLFRCWNVVTFSIPFWIKWMKWLKNNTFDVNKFLIWRLELNVRSPSDNQKLRFFFTTKINKNKHNLLKSHVKIIEIGMRA